MGQVGQALLRQAGVRDSVRPALISLAGPKPQFLALAPWVVPDAPRPSLRAVGAALAAGKAPEHYLQTALIADLPFPADQHRHSCIVPPR